MMSVVDCRQLRAARGLLDWSQRTLADRAGVSVVTVKRLENGTRRTSDASLEALVRALEGAGVAFLGTDAIGGGLLSGVALRS